MENKQYCNFGGFHNQNNALNDNSQIRVKIEISCGFFGCMTGKCNYAKDCQYKKAD